LAQECLVVCDAWKEPLPFDIANFPHLKDETRAFGIYLNQVIRLIRPNFDIIHVADNREIMEEIDTTQDKIFPFIQNIPTHYNKYYLCGFHLGRCTHGKAMTLAKLVTHDQIGIVFNLSLLFPYDDYNKMRERDWFTLYNYVHSLQNFTTDCAPQR
jgi:hypothetical protein